MKIGSRNDLSNAEYSYDLQSGQWSNHIFGSTTTLIQVNFCKYSVHVNVQFLCFTVTFTLQAPLNGKYLSLSIDQNNTLCLAEIANDMNCVYIEGFDSRLLQWIGFEDGDWNFWPGDVLS